MEIALAISILSVIITVVNFALSRKDKTKNDTEKDSYKWGSIDQKLSNIEKTLAKIEDKLDTYDKEIDEKIEMALSHHIKEYHKENLK
jgi:C-terminal processing protease CtpA/Prc